LHHTLLPPILWASTGWDTRGASMRFQATAVDEVLDAAAWRVMFFGRVLDELKCAPESRVQRLRRIAHYGKSATLRRTIRSKCRDDHMSARFYRSHHLSDVGTSRCWFSEEMKNGTVMPYVEFPFRQRDGRDVAFDPVHPLRVITQPFACNVKRSTR